MGFVEVKGKIFRKFISCEEIELVVSSIAERINTDYPDKNPLLLGVLNAAFIFAADLIRKLEIPCQISFVKYASYAGIQSSEKVNELIGLNEEIKGRHIIVVEDIVDTGITMDHLLKELHKYHPLSIRLACFCLKPDAFEKDFTIDYLGLKIPNDFIVGYGMDYDGYGRNFSEIFKLES